MAERIRIARFLDPSLAAITASFLSRCGLDAIDIDQSGRGQESGSVLVDRSQAAEARRLLTYVQDGRFTEGLPQWSQEAEEIAAELIEGIRGTGYRGATPRWLDILPVVVIAAILLTSLVAGPLLPTVADLMSGRMLERWASEGQETAR